MKKTYETKEGLAWDRKFQPILDVGEQRHSHEEPEMCK
jgi:hypothetical protein